MTIIRESTINDLDIFRQISIDTFIEAYNEKNTPADVAFYTGKYFTEAMLREELTDSTRKIFLGEKENELGGYIKLAVKPVPECITAHKALEISRIYIRKKHYGLGLAQDLLNTAIEYSLR